MKKSLLLLVLLVVAASLVAQDINKIIDKYEKAINAKKLNSFKTIKVIGTLSMGGMSMDMLLIEKAPDKIKTVITFSGMEMVTVVNGDKGYEINPFSGSSEPVAIGAVKIAQALENKMLGSSIRKQLENGKLEMVGEEEYNNVNCYIIISQAAAGDTFMFIDKKSSLIIGIKLTTMAAGQEMKLEMRMSDFKEIKGVIMAMKIDTYANGTMSMSTIFKSIEFDVPINDSEFEIK